LIFPWLRSINGFAVHFEPAAQLTQTFFEQWRYHTIGRRPNVDENVTTTTAMNDTSSSHLTVNSTPMTIGVHQLLAQLYGTHYLTSSAIQHVTLTDLCPVFELRGNPGVTRESRVTPGLREKQRF